MPNFEVLQCHVDHQYVQFCESGFVWNHRHLEHVSFGGFSIVTAVNLTLQHKPLKDCLVSPMTQYPQVRFLSKLTPSSRVKMNALPMHEQ